ncbi:MAG: DUF1028 domain-containing protein [Chloroflexi bacterium]|nr:DUF1028 domain-containing protein [Chloroflexota bacterium]
MHPSTFSIVAYDPSAEEWGVGVQSKFLAVGALVPWAKAKVGAIATQAWANLSYGPEGLHLLNRGLSAQEVVEELTKDDPDREKRQLGVVDGQGRAASFTGKECLHWAGGIVGDGFCCQGNILVSEETVKAMARAFEETQGELAERLIAALLAGQEAGGDSRGQQGAGLLVVKDKGSYGGFIDRMIDLRVDDHPTPILELKRILELHRLYFGQTDPEKLVKLDAPVVKELQERMSRTGHYQGPLHGDYDDATRQALRNLVGRENLEDRWREDEMIDGVVLSYLLQHFTK